LEITVWEGSWNLKTWEASKCWNLFGAVNVNGGSGYSGGGGSSGGGGASGTYALVAGGNQISIRADQFPAGGIIPAMVANAKVQGAETAAAKAQGKKSGGGGGKGGGGVPRKVPGGRMRSQIQRGPDHLGSQAVVGADGDKGVTAREFEQVAMLGALEDARKPPDPARGKGQAPAHYIPLIHGGFSAQSIQIRTRTVPGGGLHERRGDMNELRVCFDGHNGRPATCNDRRNTEEVRLDVVNDDGDNNLSCTE